MKAITYASHVIYSEENIVEKLYTLQDETLVHYTSSRASKQSTTEFNVNIEPISVQVD